MKSIRGSHLIQLVAASHADVVNYRMLTSPERMLDSLQQVQRCRPEIQNLAREMENLPADHYDALVRQLTESGQDRALGTVLLVAAVNKIALDPIVLANALKVVYDLRDIAFSYNYQTETAIEPLLTAALAEDLSHERQSFAARVAVELCVKFGHSKQPVKKVLWQLLERIRAPEARLLLEMSLTFLERGEEGGKVSFKLTGRDVLTELPAERPPVVIGDGRTVRRPVAKIGRNDPCPCGSGKKYKKCCYDADQETMRDASAYEGVTTAQLRDNPSLVRDASYIERLRPYELRKLIPSRVNEDQLFVAYRHADLYGLRDLAFDMLFELKGRPGKEQFAVEHMGDLFSSALKAGNMELIQKIAPHIPEKDRYMDEAERLRHELIETPDKLRDLEALCRRAFIDNREHPLLELSYAFEDILPALSLVFARAAIVSEPDRTFDNELLIDAVRTTRIALDLQPWGDPIEDYWDWVIDQHEERANNQEKDEEIRRLRDQLSEAREKSSLTLTNLREKESALAALEKKVQTPAKPAPSGELTEHSENSEKKNRLPGEKQHDERREEIHALREKIELLKNQIGEQQELRRQLRQELQAAREKTSPQTFEKAPTEASAGEREYPEGVPEKVQIPEFTDSFRKSCEDAPPALIIKAMRAAVGFGAKDDAVLRQSAALERLPGYYRIRIGMHHRLMVRKTSKNTLQILELLPRKEMDTWIRQHAS
jgi:SEC-C motif